MGAGIHRPPATAREPLFAPLGAPGGAGSTRLRGRGERDRERENEVGKAEGTGGSGTAAPGWAERPAAPPTLARPGGMRGRQVIDVIVNAMQYVMVH